MEHQHRGEITLGLVLPQYDEPDRLWDAARTADR